jgi:hypothetical protein
MIFIPCEKGISHNEAENILPEWAEKGANVLLNSLRLAADEPLAARRKTRYSPPPARPWAIAD